MHLRTKPLQLATTPGPRAEAFALARWQAATRESVTNLRHESIQFPDPFARKVLTLLDGTRDRDALLRVLAPPFANGGPAALAQPFDETLAMLARYALLIR